MKNIFSSFSIAALIVTVVMKVTINYCRKYSGIQITSTNETEEALTSQRKSTPTIANFLNFSFQFPIVVRTKLRRLFWAFHLFLIHFLFFFIQRSLCPHINISLRLAFSQNMKKTWQPLERAARAVSSSFFALRVVKKKLWLNWLKP